MDSTDGVQRGMEVQNTGKDISVPVGEVTLGRVFNVLGDTIDLEDKLDGSVRRIQFIDNHLTLTNYLLK